MVATEKITALINALKNKFVERTDIFKNGFFWTENTNNKGTVSRIFNESDGGGAQLIDGTTNIQSYVGVNEGSSGSNFYAQIYALDKTTKVGTRINVNENGAYYTSGNSTYAFTTDDEIATKGDLDTASTAGEITVEKQAVAESGYASTYVIKQGGVAINPKINIPKDQMVRSASVETVGATPNAKEAAASLATGDSYILLVVNTIDNDNGTDLIIPIDSLFDLQKADEQTLTLDGDTYSIKNKGVTATQIADETITATQIAPSLSSIWLTTANVDDEIEDYIDAITAGLSA